MERLEGIELRGRQAGRAADRQRRERSGVGGEELDLVDAAVLAHGELMRPA